VTDTETRQAATVHGEVEYEVVECDSCGAEIPADEANDFTIGDREGVACDLCVEEGPSGFPTSDRQGEFNIFGVVFWPLLASMAVEDIDSDGVRIPQRDAARFLEGSLGGIVYSTIVVAGLGGIVRLASNAGGAIPIVVSF